MMSEQHNDGVQGLTDLETGIHFGNNSDASLHSSLNMTTVANFLEDDEEAPLVRHAASHVKLNASNFSVGDALPPIAEDSMQTFSAQYSQDIPGGVHLSTTVLNGGLIQRMWEGDVFDCLEDPRVAAQTACCPCMMFGQNMKMAGFGNCFTQGLIFFLFTGGIFGICQMIALYMSSGFFHWLSFVLFFIGTGYGAYYRMEMRRKFNIHGNDMADYFYHGCCSWCALCQEGRTLLVNNVDNGVWSGRGNNVTTVGQRMSIAEIPPLSQKMSFSPGKTSLRANPEGAITVSPMLHSVSPRQHGTPSEKPHGIPLRDLDASTEANLHLP